MRALGELLEVVKFNSQCFASFEIVKEGVVGLSSFCRVFLSKVHKVGAVGKDMAKYGQSGWKYVLSRKHGERNKRTSLRRIYVPQQAL